MTRAPMRQRVRGAGMADRRLDRGRQTGRGTRMISRHLVWKCALVLFLLAPLVLLEGWNSVPPSWLSDRLGGVPMTVVASLLLFLALVILTAVYSAAPEPRRR
jgi:hypothetical protein